MNPEDKPNEFSLKLGNVDIPFDGICYAKCETCGKEVAVDFFELAARYHSNNVKTMHINCGRCAMLKSLERQINDGSVFSNASAELLGVNQLCVSKNDGRKYIFTIAEEAEGE